MTRKRAWAAVLGVVLAACVGLALPAGAQYGPTSTTAPLAGASVEFRADPEVGVVASDAVGVLLRVPVGLTVQLFFNGVAVGAPTTAGADSVDGQAGGSPAVLFNVGAVKQQKPSSTTIVAGRPTATITIPFKVPNFPVGVAYDVEARTTEFTLWDDFTIIAPGGGPGGTDTDLGTDGEVPTEVLPGRIDANQANPGGGGGDRSRGGVLPRTGADLLLWLLVALVALIVGRLLVEYSRRRRRSHAV